MLWKDCEGLMRFCITIAVRLTCIVEAPCSVFSSTPHIACHTTLQNVGGHFVPDQIKQPRSPCLLIGTSTKLCARVQLRLPVPAVSTLLPPRKPVHTQSPRARANASASSPTTSRLTCTITLPSTTRQATTVSANPLVSARIPRKSLSPERSRLSLWHSTFLTITSSTHQQSLRRHLVSRRYGRPFLTAQRAF